MLGASELQLPVDIPKSRCPDKVFVFLCRLSAQAFSLTSFAQGDRWPGCSLPDLQFSVTWSLVLEWVGWGVKAASMPSVERLCRLVAWLSTWSTPWLPGFPFALPILAPILPLQVAQLTSVPVMCADSRWLEPFHHRSVLAAALKRPMLMQQVVQALGSLTSVARASSGFLGSTLAGLGHSGHLLLPGTRAAALLSKSA